MQSLANVEELTASLNRLGRSKSVFEIAKDLGSSTNKAKGALENL